MGDLVKGSDSQLSRDSASAPAVMPRQAAGYSAAGHQHDEEVINLRALWEVLVRRKAVIITIMAMALVSALVATFVMTPVYRSTLLLQIETEGARIVDYGSVTQEETPGYRANQDYYKTQYELLESRTLARRVIDQLGLELANGSKDGLGAVFGDWASSLRSWLALSTSADRVDPVDAAKVRDREAENAFLERLIVDPIGDSRLVRLHYDSSSPNEAAKVVNAVAANFVALNLERRFEASAYAKQFLQDQLAQARATLEDAEKRFAGYAREREIVNTNDRLEITLAKLREMNTQLVVAEAQRLAAEAEYQELLASGPHGFADVLGSELVQQLKARRSDLQAQYRDNLKVLKPKYPRMLQLQEQINELSQQIDREIDSIVSGIKARHEAKAREEAKLTQRIAELKDEALALQDRSTDYETLRREVETSRELYDGLLQRMKEVGVAAGVGENNVSIVDAGTAPSKPHRPDLRMNLSLALALGLFAGLAMAFVLEALDDRLGSPEEVEALTGASVLTGFPRISVRKLGLAPNDIGTLAHVDPTSPIAEAARSLRTQLLFSTPAGVPDVLHFVSVAPGEGKTTASCNTAIAFAQAGSSVLLIDADLRNPSLQKVFALPNETGLTNHLCGAATALEVSQPTVVKGLFAITSGPLPPNPVELLASAQMVDLLSLAAERFDLVIVDGPPVIGLADALVLAGLAKATVLVMDGEQARRRDIAGGVKRLLQANAKLVGALLVKVGRADRTYGYGYSYEYHYSYGATGHRRDRPRRRKAA